MLLVCTALRRISSLLSQCTALFEHFSLWEGPQQAEVLPPAEISVHVSTDGQGNLRSLRMSDPCLPHPNFFLQAKP